MRGRTLRDCSEGAKTLRDCAQTKRALWKERGYQPGVVAVAEEGGRKTTVRSVGM